MAYFHEYGVVRVTQLIHPNRHYDGNDGFTIWQADFSDDELELVEAGY
jgi:hypothetical protein